MKITINDTSVILQSETDSAPYTLLTKPDTDDYANLTIRPLVTTYHIVRDTIWERFCQCVRALEAGCGENCGHYVLLFGALYAPLLANSQTKNILHYSPTDDTPFLTVLQDFMTFLQEDSKLISLPHFPSVFSGLAARFWQSAIINLDGIDNLQVLCDAMTRVRTNGTVLLYTVTGSIAENLQCLLAHAAKTAFSFCTLYVFTMDSTLYDLIDPCTTETTILIKSENLLAQAEELRQLTTKMEQGDYQTEDCLYAVTLLSQTEDILFNLYDYLENPRLPICAGDLKEAVMDCCSALSDPSRAPVYADRLTVAAQAFFTAIGRELQE